MFGSIICNFIVDPEVMYKIFHSISEGGYAKLLYNKFGEHRVKKELDAYLKLNFFERSGAGIGVTRVLNALRECGKLDN